MLHKEIVKSCCNLFFVKHKLFMQQVTFLEILKILSSGIM